MSTPILRFRKLLARLSSGSKQLNAGRFAFSARPRPPGGLSETSTGYMASQAEDLAARLPDLLLQASHVAASLNVGLHGLRRAGNGENFWQYRQAQPGESVTQIDWRQSARSQQAYVRETEAEAPQNTLLWCDLSASMQWHSHSALPEKRDRALLMLLAMASLLLRSGERVRILTPTGPAMLHATGTPLERLALGLLDSVKNATSLLPLPPAAVIPRYSRVLIASDFLCDLPLLQNLLSYCAGQHVKAHLLHISDPAELSLPYQGHITFEGLEQEPSLNLPHVQSLQASYAHQVKAYETALTTMATRYNHTFTSHCTQDTPLPALMNIQAQMQHKGRFAEERL